jgi:hypothetical protein
MDEGLEYKMFQLVKADGRLSPVCGHEELIVHIIISIEESAGTRSAEGFQPELAIIP